MRSGSGLPPTLALALVLLAAALSFTGAVAHPGENLNQQEHQENAHDAVYSDAEHVDAAQPPASSFFRTTSEDGAELLSNEEIAERRERVREMFRHAYESYVSYALGHDELKPLSCEGTDPLGGYGVQLVDALSSLSILGFDSEFEQAVKFCEELDFDRDVDVSVFETNIRSVGGLISGHLFALETSFKNHTYNNGLLARAVDLADRLLPAFQTASGMPLRVVNLRSGVREDASSITSPAEAGTYLLEFGMLTILTGDQKYALAARRATDAVWRVRVKKALVGSQVDVKTGLPIHTGAGKWLVIGSGVDSFYEYLLKSHLLFGDAEDGKRFAHVKRAVNKYLRHGPWHVGLDVTDMKTIDPIYRNLDAYWPGLLALAGKENLPRAVEVLTAMMSVAQDHGGTSPETYDFHQHRMTIEDTRYQLRPELGESLFYLYNSTRDPMWLLTADILLDGLASCRTTCGFAALDVSRRQKLDHMETFVLSETLMYLFLLFDEGNAVLQRQGVVFTTEGHPMWLPESVEDDSVPVSARLRQPTAGART